ncbi:MAG: phosphonate C-P lyase system protein PhnG [Rhodospirillales bacterium]|nr:phosphonate C-P lyase system protein PhnG [Rhodospirillales bacterium]
MTDDAKRPAAGGATTPSSERAEWLGVLARATREELEVALGALDPPPRHTVLKPAETGLVMLRGRAGGTGATFNMGEMSVTRCVVDVDSTAIGVGYVAGRDRRRAELVAILDGALQDPARRPAIARDLLSPVALRREAARRATACKAAATKVDFFTLVRGE